MGLSTELISQFVKVTKDDTSKNKSGSTVYGTAVEYNGAMYARLDGSELLTPITTTADIKNGERVTVLIQDHTATVTGNVSSPSASSKTVKEIGSKISEFEIVIADKVDTVELNAERARIDDLVADNVTINGKIKANEADISNLKADNVTISGKLTAQSADINDLKVKKLDAEIASLTYATIDDLDVTDANIYNLRATYGEFTALTANKFSAIDGYINDLRVDKLSATDADLKYANIDFTNIGEAALKVLYSDSGLIRNLVISEGTITGELVGVTIRGDLIEGNTIVADKLVIKGEDGLYYKLNTNGTTIEAEQTEYNSLDGSVILAKSIVASKIAVDDLVAFDATIGGFKITKDSIYSGVKSSVNNTTRGIYLDNAGQVAFGDGNNFLKYYKDTDGIYKLAISAGRITLGASSKDVETAVTDLQEETESLRDEIATVMHIESSMGTVFRNNAISTVLNAVIYRGTTVIRDMETLQLAMGYDSYLQWSELKKGSDAYETISSSDIRISEDGFKLAVSPSDVNAQVTYKCELNS